MRQGNTSISNYSFTEYAGGNERYGRQRHDKERLQLNDFVKIINELEKYKPLKGTLLEIGCAMGTNLNELRKAGWQVTGVEPEKWTCEEARNKFQLNVINAKFQDAGLDESSYDVILMFHVIEHLPDPYDAIKFLSNLLKPGGILVLETPRYDTITFKLLKGRERSVIPGHLYYFTRKSFRMIAQNLGLNEIVIQTVGRTVTFDRLCFYLAKFINNKYITKIITNFSDKLNLNKMHIYINIHDMMRVYLIKPNNFSN